MIPEVAKSKSPEGGRLLRWGGLLATSLAAFVLLGMADSGLGVSWPTMRSVFSRELADLGVLIAFLSVGYLAASSGYGRLHSRIGTGSALVLGGSTMGAALLGLALAPGWAFGAISSALLGVGAGLIDVGMNAHAALNFDVASINLLHGAYGVGATLGPVLITVSLAAGGAWRAGYVVLAAAQAGVVLLIWRGRRSWRTPDHPGIGMDESRAGPLRIASLLLLFLLYTGVEVATGQWAFSLLHEGRAIDTSASGLWVAAYWGGLTAGRLALGAFGERIPASKILDVSVLMALGGIGLLWLDPAQLGVLGLPIAGLGLSAVFPTMVSLTPSRIGRFRSARMVGYQLAAANIGAATMPWTVGLIAGKAGLGSLAPALFAMTSLLAVLHLMTDRWSRSGWAI